jgi:hypothetical protein
MVLDAVGTSMSSKGQRRSASESGGKCSICRDGEGFAMLICRR